MTLKKNNIVKYFKIESISSNSIIDVTKRTFILEKIIFLLRIFVVAFGLCFCFCFLSFVYLVKYYLESWSDLQYSCDYNILELTLGRRQISKRWQRFSFFIFRPLFSKSDLLLDSYFSISWHSITRSPKTFDAADVYLCLVSLFRFICLRGHFKKSAQEFEINKKTNTALKNNF